MIQALEHYEDLADIKRVIVHAAAFPIDVSGIIWHVCLSTNSTTFSGS